jgi:hypothetical protein
MPELFFLLFFVPGALVLVKAFAYAAKQVTRLLFGQEIILDFLVMIAYPFLFYLIDPGINDCCGDSAAFAPEHRLTVWVFVVTTVVCFFLAKYLDRNWPPLLYVIINGMLLLGFVFNIFLLLHEQALFAYFTGSIQLNLLLAMYTIASEDSKSKEFVNLEIPNWFIKLQNLEAFYKYPIMGIITAPIYYVINMLLILFGQQPDSMIKAFTETYKHNFSKLDYECIDVVCGGGCYVFTAANYGHQKLVKPQRIGYLGTSKVICNRQVLVANAFEQLLQNRCQRIHAVLRQGYDAFGRHLVNHPKFYKNKYVASLMYLSLKPIEWMFLVVIYTVHRQPESLIHGQYLNQT